MAKLENDILNVVPLAVKPLFHGTFAGSVLDGESRSEGFM